MTHAYRGLLHLLLEHPDRLPWLIHHAWHWHKGPIAMLLFFSAFTLCACYQLARAIARRGKEAEN